MNEPLVSVIIPAFNAAETIETSCRCALAQSEQNIEVIVVDDGSEDETAEIVEGIAQKDGRLKLVCHPQNKGRMEARRSGITQAKGEFALFLDADDEILPDMATTLLAAQENRFDIVQCNFELRYLDYISADEKRFNDSFNRPPATTAFGDDVTHVVYRDRRTTWSLCGKLIRTALLKAALTHIPESTLTQAEDACTFFIVSSLAQSYKGLPSYRGYVYNIDLGHSDARWRKMNIEQFSYSCRYVDSMNIIRDYIDASGQWDTLGDDYRIVRYEHVRAVADKLIRYVENEAKAAAFEMLVTSWEPEEAIAGLCEAGWEEPANVFASVSQSPALKCAEHEVKTVAAYHYGMQIGGAERVAADLVRLWTERGYRVVFFADEPRSACAYDLPESVAWVELPSSATMQRGDFLARAQAIAEAVRTYEIDAFVNHQWWNRLIAWDTMLLKTLGVPVCVINHNVFISQFYEPNIQEFDHPRILRYVDALVVLSVFDKRFWDQFNPRVRCTVNPITTQPTEEHRSQLTGKNVVWVGRLSSFDKQPQEAIEIMARVIARDPECTLTLVGPAPSKLALARLKALTRSLGIEENVEFAGAHDDPSPFYERASVHLLTSRLDGWCLVLAESKAHGLPCVMFEMPYLTLTQGNAGIIAVEHGDRDGAAHAISQLLADNELRQRMGDQAFASIQEIAAIDRGAFWCDLFDELAQGSPNRTGLDDADAQWDLLIGGFQTSISKALDLSVPAYAKRKGAKVAKKAWHLMRGGF